MCVLCLCLNVYSQNVALVFERKGRKKYHRSLILDWFVLGVQSIGKLHMEEEDFISLMLFE
jgi:hypothetical protein